MAKKPKPKVEAVDAPQNIHECACRISGYGELLARRAQLAAEMDERKRQIGEEYQDRISKIDERIKEELRAIQMFCEPKRGELADEQGVKYIQFTTGRVEWRKQNDTIRVPTDADDQTTIIGLLEQRGLHRFIRVKREVSKEMMLAEREKLPGLIAGIPGLELRIGKEAFSVKPEETLP